MQQRSCVRRKDLGSVGVSAACKHSIHGGPEELATVDRGALVLVALLPIKGLDDLVCAEVPELQAAVCGLAASQELVPVLVHGVAADEGATYCPLRHKAGSEVPNLDVSVPTPGIDDVRMLLVELHTEDLVYMPHLLSFPLNLLHCLIVIDFNEGELACTDKFGPLIRREVKTVVVVSVARVLSSENVRLLSPPAGNPSVRRHHLEVLKGVVVKF